MRLQGKTVFQLPAAGLLGLAVAAGCAATDSADKPKSSRYVITCTTGMVTDIVRQVVGDRAEVRGIIGEAVDPHLYQATRNDIALLAESDVVFYSGLMLEGRMSDALMKIGRKRPVYAVTELLDRTLLLEPPEFKGHFDPHVWMDVSLWKKCTRMVADALADFDTEHKAYYLTNYEQYAKRLDELDAYARRTMATIPRERRILVTAHDAFNYFARAYDLRVEGIQGISTESEAGIADIGRIVDLIVDHRIPAVFVESSVSQKNVMALIEGATSRGHQTTVGGTLFSDAMGPSDKYEGSYIGMIDHNVTTIASALGGSPPPGGMHGKLDGHGGRSAASTTVKVSE